MKRENNMFKGFIVYDDFIQNAVEADNLCLLSKKTSRLSQNKA